MFTSDEKPAIGKQINRFLLWLDRIPLWWTGILIVVVFFFPYFILGDGCIFEINDQLDESIMNYMLPARHLWDGSTVYPEMLGGVNASGMQPSAILFLPLYCLFSARVAFLTQYMICFVLAFLGMYLLVKESTESSILAVIAGHVSVCCPYIRSTVFRNSAFLWWHMPFCVCGNGKESFPH